MNGYYRNSPQGAQRRLKNSRPQFVLNTDNGTQRTSHVTDARIMKAVYEIEANHSVVLERCTPLKLISRAECFAIAFYSDSHVAVFFRVQKTVLCMVRYEVSRDVAADIMCDFFLSDKLPDMSAWTLREFSPAPRPDKPGLCVDGEDFRYFNDADVVAALDNIIDGNSRWMLYEFSGEINGYIEIRRCGSDSDPDNAIKYNVECVGWTEPEPTGYRTVTRDVDSLRKWLWDLVDGNILPNPTPGWERFDVSDYFRRLSSRFSDNE